MSDDEPVTYDWEEAWAKAEKPAPPVNGAVHHIDPARLGRYAAKALAAEASTVAAAEEGTRNDTLNTAAYNLGQLVGAGQLTEDDVRHTLTDAARTCGLDHSETQATISSGIGAGLLEPRVIPEPPTSNIPAVTVLNEAIADATGETSDDRTSWWPRPITQAAEHAQEQPEPTHLARDDGNRLLYSGKVNGLLGESESGKTWVALLAVAQTIQVGEHVLYLDFEDSADGIENRMGDLGCADKHLACLDYANPDESLGIAQSADLAEALATQTYTLIVVDGVNAAMTMLGYDIDASNKDATLFAQKLLRPLSGTGAAVVTVDHVPKNKDARGKGGIGAQAKRAMMNGAAIAVEMTRPFGKGLSGEMRLTVDKDRPGRVRGISQGGKNAGTVPFTAEPDGTVTMRIETPDLRPIEERGPFRPTGYMQKVSQLLEEVDGLSGADLERELVGKATTIRQAVTMLVTEGYVRREKEGKALNHYLIRPYRELAFGDSDD